MKRAALCLLALLCVSALLAKNPKSIETGGACTAEAVQAPEAPPASSAQSDPLPPAEAPAAPDVPWEEIQAEFLPLPAGPGGTYTVGSAPVNWRFSIRTDAITDEEHYRPSDWLDSARAAVMDSALYRAALAESDRHTQKELKETYADYGDYYGWDDVLRPKFVSGITSDFDRNGETESFLVFRLPLAGVWGGYIDCVAFVGWGGEAALVTLSANTELSEINYGEHMTLVGVRSYTGRIADHSYREYRVRDGKPVCVLDQFRAGESVGDVFRRFGMAQCPYEWLLFWDADREAYAQVALEPVDSGTISALYRSGAEQPFDESYLELNWTVAGGVYYQAAPGGQPRGYRYENGQFFEDAPLGENGYLLNAHGGDPIPTALGVNIAQVMEQAYPRRISETRYASLADGSSVALRFSGYGDMSYFAGEAEKAEFDTLEIIDGGKVTQTFPLEPYRSQMNGLVDYNFDGNQDILSWRSQGNLGRYYDCFLWNPQSRLYEIYLPFSSLPYLEADPARKRIYTHMPCRPYGSMWAALRWEDGVLVFDEASSRFTLYPIPMSCTTALRQQGEEVVRERRYTLDEESAELILNRPAARFETPEVAGVDDMLRILPFASDRNTWIDWPGTKLPDLLELVYAHNREFLSIGSGVGGADLKRLRGLHRNVASPSGLSITTVYSGRFARFDDMERAGEYLFGDEFRLEGGECGDCGDRIFYTEPLKVADGRGSETRSVLPLAVKQEADSCEITFAEILVAGDFIVHPRWTIDENWEMPGIIVGYVGDDGGYYFYDDVDLDRFPRYTATFRQAGDGHYYIADCEEIQPDNAE